MGTEPSALADLLALADDDAARHALTVLRGLNEPPRRFELEKPQFVATWSARRTIAADSNPGLAAQMARMLGKLGPLPIDRVATHSLPDRPRILIFTDPACVVLLGVLEAPMIITSA